jgi:hypothetical protein
VRRDGVDRAGQRPVGDRAQVYVEQVVDPDPGEPLRAVTERPAQTGREQRVHQAQHAAARCLHDAGADLHRPDPGHRRGSGRVLPGGDHVGEEPVATAVVLGQQLIATVWPVDAYRGRGDEGAQRAWRARGQFGELTGRPDPAGADLLLALGREPAGDRGAGEVEHRIRVVQQFRIRVIRPPLPLAGVPRRPADQADDLVTPRGQQGRQGGPDQPARARHRDR